MGSIGERHHRGGPLKDLSSVDFIATLRASSSFPLMMDMTNSLQQLTELLKSDLEKRPGYKGRLKFDLGDHGVIVIDGSNEPPTVDNADRETESTICVDITVMMQLMTGNRTAAAVYQAGDMTIKGDLQVAVNIVPFLGRS